MEVNSQFMFNSSPDNLPSLPYGHYWVPCLLNTDTGTFYPVYDASSYPFYGVSKPVSKSRPPSRINRGGMRLQTWRSEEDSQLSSLVEQFGRKQWTRIAKTINDEFHNSEGIRKAKHCRERFFNYLDPELNSNF